MTGRDRCAVIAALGWQLYKQDRSSAGRLGVNGADVFRTLSGSTDAAGLVSFIIKNAPAGAYVATVTGLSAGGLTWDGITPANSFTK